MAKFKKGDRVRALTTHDCASHPINNHKKGDVFTIREVQKKTGFITFEEKHHHYTDDCSGWELVEPTYQPITPKVGERYRVIKHPRCGNITTFPVGSTIKLEKYEGKVGVWNGKRITPVDYTTEYLELVEEPKRKIEIPANYYSVPEWKFDQRETIEKIYREWIAPELNNKPKQTIMQKLTSALKRALSADKQTLYKAGLINGGLDLSSEGRNAYVNALFQNDGDHTKAVAEMVEAAKEELAEDED